MPPPELERLPSRDAVPARGVPPPELDRLPMREGGKGEGGHNNGPH